MCPFAVGEEVAVLRHHHAVAPVIDATLRSVVGDGLLDDAPFRVVCVVVAKPRVVGRGGLGRHHAAQAAEVVVDVCGTEHTPVVAYGLFPDLAVQVVGIDPVQAAVLVGTLLIAQ